MPDREWVAFDLETTGLVAEIDRVVEIGAVRFDATGRELDRFERLVNPQRPMSPAAQSVHGISDADLATAAPARVVLPEFLGFLGDARTTTLLAHHAWFDAGFLGHELERASLPRPDHAVVDTLALARRLLPDLPNHRLSTLAERLDLGDARVHRALADSVRVKELWLALRGPLEPSEQLFSYPIRHLEPTSNAPLGWDRLAVAIARGSSIRIEYSGGTRGSTLREVTPTAFVHRGGVPYLVAYCHLDAFEKSFRLDRVRRYEIVSDNGSSV